MFGDLKIVDSEMVGFRVQTCSRFRFQGSGFPVLDSG